jgi:gas vesicle protein
MSRSSAKLKRELDSGTLIFGIFMGLLVGGVATLFKTPKSGVALRRQIAESVSGTGQNLRSSLEAVVPSDPVAESMAQGKAAARRRLAELGQGG